ncbi:MAG TPA: asparagine synthase (glutamine-hydrolyzing) [Steroidobacteraceae bacterium]|nr:asparagine synthase (glutamine-hydrolyzing) [Steroidobacteraceae bacterium]
MCGLVGFVGTSGVRSDSALRALTGRMITELRHRGPDGEGVWVDALAGVALGHRRLSIVDLSSHGAQPMVSHSGRYLLAYNGEIYNHMELREELERAGGAIAWRGHSDTETALAAIDRWGLHAALPRFNGMFALALWDREERRLNLARDRFGEKPLYYAAERGCFLFGSELKALLPHPAFAGEIDRGALRAYMRLNYVPAPFTIYRTARKLPPGSVLTVAVDPVASSFSAGDPQRYWSPIEVALAARERRLDNRADAEDELRELLASAVRSRMMADVPLGAFLSGGIDSSLIVAQMRQVSNRVLTFTIGFEDPSYDESIPAARVAQHLGTTHTCERVTPSQAREAIIQMPAIYDEPFADSSQIPTYLVSRAARQHVTVALTGDGGDELFGGYHRYFVGQRAFPVIRSIPGWVRRPLASLIRTMPPASWQNVIGWLRRLSGRVRLGDLSGERLHRLALQLRASSEAHMYEILMARPEDETVALEDCEERQPGLTSAWLASLPPAEAMMLLDTINILPDDFLTKVDRASMAVSLETRAPFLDPRLFEFAWRLPLEWRIGPSAGKIMLREVLRPLVPAEIVARPKQGFGIPVGGWLKGPLRPWAESLLDERRLRQEGFLSPGPIRRKWAEHLAGTHDRQSEIWAAVVFQEWLAGRYGSPAALSA